MIEVWGRTTSSNVQVVMWAAAELGLEVRRIDAGHSFGVVETAEYRAMNPMGLVPVMRDDGGPPIWEAGACLRYLSARYGDEAFWPSDPARRAQLDIWAEWTKTSFLPVLIYKVFWQLVRTAEADRDAAMLEAGIAEAGRLAGLLDARIGEGPWLGGEAFSFVDVMAGHALYRYYDLPFARPETPALDAYYARLTARPAYREHVMVSYEPLRVT